MKKKILWILLALLSTSLHATQIAVPLQPLPQQIEAAHLAVKVLSHENYEHLPLDENLSAAIFEHYLKALDPDKSIFLQSDIDQFADVRPRLGDVLLNDDLHIPFAIFNLRQQRIAEHLTYARSLLKHGFDFHEKDSYQPDRKNAARPTTEEEMHNLWRKRVKNDWLRLELAGKEAKSIVDILDRRYDNSLKSISKVKSEDVFQTLMDAFALAYDPHTDYFGVRATEAFDISMKLSLVGIGAELQFRDDYITIVHLLPGSPAALSGKLKAGDRILGVGQGETGPLSDVIGARVDDAVALIRGPENSVVRLDVLPAQAGPDGSHLLISLGRKKISLEKRAAKKSTLTLQDGVATHHIGVITLPTFYRDFSAQKSGDNDFKSAARDVSRILEEFKKEHVEAVLLDLRNNGGGSVEEAIELTGLFVDQGPVVQLLDSRNRVTVRNIMIGGSAAWTGPLGVLINHASASASEIFAAAIQDYGRGIVIGETSFGKGTTQTIVNLDRIAKNDKAEFGEIKLTNSRSFRINGDGLQLRGVTPDIALPMLTDAENFGESNFDNPLPWRYILHANYNSMGDFSHIVPILVADHNARISKDKAFQNLLEDIAEFKLRRKKNLISLNEAERSQERDALAAREKLREQVKATGKGSADPGRQSGGRPARQDDGLQPSERSLVTDPEPDNSNDKDVLLTEAAHILNDEISILKN